MSSSTIRARVFQRRSSVGEVAVVVPEGVCMVLPPCGAAQWARVGVDAAMLLRWRAGRKGGVGRFRWGVLNVSSRVHPQALRGG
jgi:hypothetical protein